MPIHFAPHRFEEFFDRVELTTTGKGVQIREASADGRAELDHAAMASSRTLHERGGCQRGTPTSVYNTYH